MGRRRRVGYCRKCPPGTANAQPNHECLPCPGGTSAPQSGMKHCEGEICTPGFAGPVQQSTTSLCVACEPGQYQPGYGAHECRLCGSGQHQVQTGQARCEGVGCPVGAVAAPGAVANQTCRRCPPGQHEKDRLQCVPCGYATYAPHEGLGACLAMPECPSPHTYHAAATRGATDPWDCRPCHPTSSLQALRVLLWAALALDLLLLLAWLCDRYAALVPPDKHSIIFHNPVMAIPDGIMAGMVEHCPHNGISPELECGGWLLVGLSAISACRIGAKALHQPLQRLRSSLAASTTTTSGGARIKPNARA